MTEKELLTKYVNEAKSEVDNKRRSVEFLKNHIDEHKRELAAIEAVAFSTSATFEKREFFRAKIEEKKTEIETHYCGLGRFTIEQSDAEAKLKKVVEILGE